MYCVWQVNKTPTIISNNPVEMNAYFDHQNENLVLSDNGRSFH